MQSARAGGEHSPMQNVAFLKAQYATTPSCDQCAPSCLHMMKDVLRLLTYQMYMIHACMLCTVLSQDLNWACTCIMQGSPGYLWYLNAPQPPCQAMQMDTKSHGNSMYAIMQLYKSYDRILTKYMSKHEGIGLDLTLVSC